MIGHDAILQHPAAREILLHLRNFYRPASPKMKYRPTARDAVVMFCNGRHLPLLFFTSAMILIRTYPKTHSSLAKNLLDEL